MPGIAARRLTALLALALSLAPPIRAQERSRQEEPNRRLLGDRVTSLTLENGWSFLLLPRREVPSISFETCVATGPAHEPADAPGVSLLLQRLLFNGSDRVGTRNWEEELLALEAVEAARAERRAARGEPEPALAAAEEALRTARERAERFADPREYRRILENAGGGESLGSWIAAEETHFVVSLPSNRLELWCWMEAERFSRPALRGLAAECEALLEDRGGDPAEALSAALLRLEGAPGAGGPGGGRLEEPPLLSRESTLAFFRARCAPRFLTTAIVGDFDPATLVPMLERYFAPLPASEPRERALPAEHPASPENEERRVEVEGFSPPQVMLGWRVPPLDHADRPAIELALRLLGGARSARLQRRLVRPGSLAAELEVTPSASASRLGDLAVFRAIPAPSVTTARLEEEIHRGIAELAREGPTPEELAGGQRLALAEQLRRLRDNRLVAAGLVEYQVRAGDWNRFFDLPALASAVTSRDVQRVLATYFTPEQCSVATRVRREEG